MKNIFHPNASEPDPETEEGCGFMHAMLNELADGIATGIKKWYAEAHVAGCSHCAMTLARLKKEQQVKAASMISDTEEMLNQ